MKNFTPLYTALFFLAVVFGVFYFMMPQTYDVNQAPLSEFSTQRALKTVKAISQKPHFVGSKNHEEIVNYLQQELQKLGLNPTLQQGFTMTEKGTLVNSKNILATIKGSSSSKALVLLSHYDSAPHSYSKGASDDASGIATIIESVRAFLHNKTPHKNDIIILFTDAEEIGLNGAALFVTQHKLAKQVGLVLNLEARGSSGPGYMLIETNNGNAKLIQEFSKANVAYPVSNSLMYSIYKMLPNDTDLTVFREKGNIQGFNFAFIDSHYHYHTTRDNYENLDKNTLAHQGSYLFPLLNYFSNSNLSQLTTKEENVYFNIPFWFIHYPFSYIIPLFVFTAILFFLIVFIGLGKRNLQMPEIAKGFFTFFATIISTGLTAYLGWKFLLIIYPHYNEILQGFTYNGHDYIYAFISLSLALCFFFYSKPSKKNNEMSQTVAPIFVWLLVNVAVAIKLKGAAFLIIPVISTLFMLALFVITQKSNAIVNAILAIPNLLIIVPFIQMFPIGLGLKILAGSAVLTVLAFGLLLPVFGSFSRKGIWGFLFFMLSVGLFVKAHQESQFSTENPKPNSLVYVYNADENKAYYATYDKTTDTFTEKYLGKNPQSAAILNKEKLYSKYGTEFSLMNKAPIKNLQKPTINFVKDTIIGANRHLKIVITPNRAVNRYDIFSNEKLKLNDFKANGVKSIELNSPMIKSNTSNKILSYYVVDNAPLEMEFFIDSTEDLNLKLVESSFDLMSNPLFNIHSRTSAMIPKPFVLNDAVVIRQKIKPTPKPLLINNVYKYKTKYKYNTIKPVADSLQ